MSTANDKDLERTRELFSLLQGEVPEGYEITENRRPKLTDDQAWTVIWYLGNQYWQVPDAVDRCDVCGSIFHSHQDGTRLDFGDSPHSFCESCVASEEYATKASSPENPENKE